MQLFSPAFSSEIIPLRFTCLGENVHPPLIVKDAPESTVSFVLLFEDLDSFPIWTHWLVYNIPYSLSVGETYLDVVKGEEGLANNNSFGYEGPCPKYFTGTHKYRFTLFALNCFLHFNTPLNRKMLEEVLNNSVLAKSYLEISCSASAYDVVV